MPEIVPKIGSSVALIVLGLLFGMIVAVLVMQLFSLGIDDLYTSRISLLIGEAFMPVPIILWVRRIGNNFKSSFRFRSVSISSVLAAIPLGLGLTIIIDELDRIAQMIYPVPEDFVRIQDFMRIDSLSSALLIIGVVVLIAPLLEEMIFRGFFQRILEYRLKDVTKAVLFSALTFAVVHFNPWWVVQIYLIGLFFGYVAWRTNSIWIPFLLHALNNGISVWFANMNQEDLAGFGWHGHTPPLLLLAGVVLFYLGLRWFIRVTPVANKDEDVMNIEDFIKKQSSSDLRM